MIFVTVGTGSFDKLIMEMDKIAENTHKQVICQIGNGKYIPKNCKWFRYKNNIMDYIQKAELIVSHGGAGTIFNALKLNKKIIGINNPDVAGNHQSEILNELSKNKNLIWCVRLEDLKDNINQIKKIKLTGYRVPECTIHEEIKKYLEKN